MKLSDLKQIGKLVATDVPNEVVLVIDYYDPPPTVELSDGRVLQGDAWDDEVKENAHEQT